MEGFCIREFASRMRSVDVVKCWPFDETTNEETVKSLLPPIIIKKFTWWVDELEYLSSKSSQNVENSTTKKKKKKKMGQENGIRNKATPKKRSIVEIFAVAPQVERVSTSSDEEDDENGVPEEINWGVKGKRNEKKKKNNNNNNKEIILNKLKKTKKVIEKTKKMVKEKVDLSSVTNKENNFNSKLQSQDKATETRKPSKTKEPGNDRSDRLSIKRKPCLQRLGADKKTMTCKAFISEKDNPVLLNGRGILKNHSKSYLGEPITMNHFVKQKAYEHVTFTENDEPSLSHLSNIEETVNRKLEASSQSTPMNNSNSFRSQTSAHLSREELLHTLCSLPHRNQTGSICGKGIINEIDKDFVGLPLNSHGELIPRNSIATLKSFGNHSQFRSWDSGTFSEDYVKENPIAMPSRSNITGWQTNGIPPYLDFDLLQINDDSLSIDKEDRKFQKSHENEKIQSTMRLMGKDFIVGRNSFQEFEDGTIWKDKQFTNELHFDNKSISNVMIHDQNEPSLGKLGEILFCPSDITMNQRAETNLMHQNAFVSRKVNQFQNLYPSLSPNTSTEVYNSESLFPEPMISGYEHDPKKNLYCAPNSAIKFPFMHPDFEGPVQSSWSRNSYMNRPSLFFDASEKGTPTMRNYQSYRDFSPSHHPSVMTGTNQWTKSSVSLNPEVFYTQDPFSSGSMLQSSVDPISSTPMLNPSYPGFVPIPVKRRKRTQKKIRDQIKSKVGIRGLDHGKKAKWQHLTLSNVQFNQFENPRLGFQEGPISKTAMWDQYGIYTSMDSYSAVERAGPIKLSAGAKHILTASQLNNQNSFRTIDPEIPLVAMNTDFRFLRI